MHLVLASQTLGGAYSFTTYYVGTDGGSCRTPMRWADAMLILSEDNTAAERLRYSGQAIYNEAGGRIESNQGFQVSYLSRMTNWLASMHYPLCRSSFANDERSRTSSSIRRAQATVWDDRSIDLAMAAASNQAGGYTMLLGDSVAIDPPVIKAVHRTRDAIVFVVGTEETMAAAC